MIPSLDGIRAVAVLLVFVGHSDRLPHPVRGSLGVTMFFFLSGYLITTLLRMEHDRHGWISLKAFYLRRALRIFPPLYLVLAAGSLCVLLGIVPGDLSPAAVTAGGLHMTNYLLIVHDSGIPDGLRPLWSLAVEEHFYLLFPVAYVALLRRTDRRRQALVLVAVCVAVLLWRIVLAYGLGVAYFDRIYVGTDTRVDSILWGCVLGVAANPHLDPPWLRTQLAGRWMSWVALPAATCGLLAAGTLDGNLRVFETTIQALCMAVIVTIVVRHSGAWAGRVLNSRPMVFVGVMSYSLYLMHRFFIDWANEHLASWDAMTAAAVTLAAALASAFVIHVWVERPATRLRRRLSRAENQLDSSPISDADVTLMPVVFASAPNST